MKMCLIICCVMLSAIGVQGMSISEPKGNSILVNDAFGSIGQANNVEQSAPNTRDVLLHYVEAFVDAEKRRTGGVAMMDSAYWSVSHYDHGRGTNATTTSTTTPPSPPTNPKTSAPEPTTTPAPTRKPELPNLPSLPDIGFPTLPEIPTLPDLPWNSCNNKMWSGIWCPPGKGRGRGKGWGWGIGGGIGGGIGLF